MPRSVRRNVRQFHSAYRVLSYNYSCLVNYLLDSHCTTLGAGPMSKPAVRAYTIQPGVKINRAELANDVLVLQQLSLLHPSFICLSVCHTCLLYTSDAADE